MSGRIEVFNTQKEPTSKWSQNEAFQVREAGVDIGKTGGQGGSNVSVDQVVTSGREVAGVTVDGQRTAILVPNEGSFVQSDWNENDPSEDAYIKNKPSLATVATSGSYEDLSDQPDLSGFVNDSNYVHTDNNFNAAYKAAIDGLDDALAGKVDKVSGKVLSDNNYSNLDKQKVSNLADIYYVGTGLTLDPTTKELTADAQHIDVDNAMSSTSENPVQNKVITAALGDKVDKVSGKVLSDNNFSNADKQKLDGIDQGAEVNDISTISVNGVNVPADANKNVDLQISSGTEYTAGDGIDISNNVISAETPIFTGTRSDWDALSLAEKQAYGQANITDDANGIVVNNIATFAKADLYSTDEKMIGRWIDGKPLYQKTVDTGVLPNNTTKNVAHGIANIEHFVNVWGIAERTDGTFYGEPLPRVITANDSKAQLVVRVDLTNVILLTTANLSSTYGRSYVTVQYTKTTDSAVDIGSSNDYSTSEKIVGTWIDGKPIYQKTKKYTNISISSSSWSSVDSEFTSDIEVSIKSEALLVGNTDDYFNAVAVLVAHSGDAVKMKSTSGASISGVDVYLTLQYTKTTD